MDAEQNETAADLLVSARRSGTTKAAPEGWPPADGDSAERIRDLATERMGEPVAGYKIGATSPEAQRIIGCDTPFYGPLFRSGLLVPGSTFALPEGVLGVECEFAFRIDADQEGGGDWTRERAAGLVRSCHPALEIIGRRTAGEGFPGYTAAVADFALNVAFVPGPRIEDWREVDLAAAKVEGQVDSVPVKAGSGAQVLGHPLEALAWLAGALAARDRGLKAGDWVTTGTCLGVVPARRDTRVTGEFGALGSVSVDF